MSGKIPKLCRHRGTGQGTVTLSGRTIYCGKWPSGMKSPPDAVAERYKQVIGEYLAGKRVEPSTRTTSNGKPDYTVTEILGAFWQHATEYHRSADGTPARELSILKRVMKTLKSLYGNTSASAFGPLALKAVRDEFVREGLSRKTINSFVIKIRSIFRWAASVEMLAGSQVADLESVVGLRPGRSLARETIPIEAPPAEVVTAVIAELPSPLQELANVLRYSGARCGEVMSMRLRDVDRSSAVWVFKPEKHKGTWRGSRRVIFFGSKCQSAISPLIEGLQPDDFVFSPRRAEVARLAAVTSKRKTRLWPSHAKRNATKRKEKRTRPPGEKYTSNVLARAMRKVARRLYPLPAELERNEGESLKTWRARLGTDRATEAELFQRQRWPHPHVLRHCYASEVRQALGLDYAEKSLGHSSVQMSAHYSRASDEMARTAAEKLG